jgi:hypothetical protein
MMGIAAGLVWDRIDFREEMIKLVFFLQYNWR